jgi:hypothetical protein
MSSFCATTAGVGSRRKRYVSKMADVISIVTVSPAVPLNCTRSMELPSSSRQSDDESSPLELDEGQTSVPKWPHS